jgi:hypothetical protein
MKINIRVLYSFLLVFTGCAFIDTHDSRALTRFDPINQNEDYEIWKYEAFVPAGGGDYGFNDLGEATRMRWLVEHLRINNLSSIDYEIVDKKTSIAAEAWAGKSYKIFYFVKIPRKNSGLR